VVTDPTETPDGLLWDAPIRVTDNNLDDVYPTVDVDPSGNAHIVYLQGGQDYLWAKINSSGALVQKEKLLITGFVPTQYQIKNESTEQPTSHMGVDSQGNLHVIWTMAGYLDNRYQKFDSTGEPVTPVMLLNQITALSRLPYLVIGKDDRAYIAYESEGTAWVQMTYVTPSGLMQAPALIGRPGENVAYTIDDNGYIHLFYRSLGSDVSMWWTKLDPDRNPLIGPKVIFPNTSKIANPYSSMPTLTTTPNGHVHVLLSDTTIAPHPIWYIELDGDGRVVNDWTKIIENSHNYGDIVGCSDNSVMVFWDNTQDGEIHYMKIVDGDAGEEIVITDTGGLARAPQVVLGNFDDVHLTYTVHDMFDREVHYRYANNYFIRLCIGGSISQYYLHPGESFIFNITTVNVGELDNFIALELDVDYRNHTGWGVDLENENQQIKYSAGERKDKSLTVFAPDSGEDGDTINITVTAKIQRNLLKSVSVNLDIVLTIRRELVWSGPSEIPLDDYDGTISFLLTNFGDVDENITLSVNLVPPAWNVTITPMAHYLELHGDVGVELSLSAPGWVEQGWIAPLVLVARSTEDINLSWAHEIIIIIKPEIFLQWTGKTSDSVLPGKSVTVPMDLENRGSGPAQVLFSTRLVSGTGDWGILLDPVQHQISSHDSVAVETTVRAPVNAVAGSSLVFELVARAGGVEKAVKLSVVVKELGGARYIIVDRDTLAVIKPGQAAELSIKIRNPRNIHLEETLSAENIPLNWRWGYTMNDQISPVLSLPPFATGELKLLLSSSWNATPGNYSLKTIIGGGSSANILEFTVQVIGGMYGLNVSTLQTHKWVNPGESVVFEFLLVNEGSIEDYFSLDVKGLPSGWQASHNPSNMLASGSSQTVKVGITVPADTRTNIADLEMNVISSSGLMVSLDLQVEVRMPDLKITNWAFSKDSVNEGDPVEVTVQVSNSGNLDVAGADVEVNGKRKSVDLAAGKTGEIVFNIKPGPGKSNVIIWIDPDDMVPETREDNNIERDQVEVRESGIPGFGIFLFLGACLVALVLYGAKSKKEK
jgi:uncharacterized membrane protein